MPNFKQMPMAPSQVMMFPVSVEDSLPADCDVRLVGEAMEVLDWRAFEAAYADTGRPAYPPKVMCKLLVYGYSKRIRSSRALEEVVQHDQRYIWLAGGLKPDQTTIARFRKEHLSELKAIYRATVRICTPSTLLRVVSLSNHAECVRPQSKRGRSVQVSVVAAEREGMRQRLKTAEGKALYQLRSQIAERVIARLKANLGLNRFGLAGIGGAGAELWLVCVAHNLLTYLRKGATTAQATVRRLSARLANRMTRPFQRFRYPFHPVGLFFR